MTAIYKEPGRAPELIRIPDDKETIRKKLGGDFEMLPLLRGALILCRKEDPSLPFNVHIMGGRYCGPVLFTGRSETDTPVDLSPQLQVMLTKVLSQKGEK